MASVPGQFNTFVASHEATGAMVTDFSRNPAKFALPQYVQYTPVKQTRGFWVEMTVEQAGRVLDSTGNDVEWADGNDAPRGAGNNEKFSWQSYVTRRFAIPFEMGEIAADQAAWDILAQHARISAQRAMTIRTQRVVTLLTTTGNYLSSNLIDVSSPPSGLTLSSTLDAATSSNMDIKRTLDFAYLQIQKNTLAAVAQDEVIVVMNPLTAQRLANTQEIRDTVKQSPFSMDMITKQLGRVGSYGLPATLYGYPVVIEDAVKVTTQKGATTSKSHVLGDGNIMMLSRPGGLVGVEGSPSFSSCTLFLKDELVVENKHDVDNKRHTGRVIDQYDVKMTSQLASVLIYNATA